MGPIVRLLLAGMLLFPVFGRTDPQIQPTGEPSVTRLPDAYHLALVRVTLRNQGVLEGRLLGLTGSGIVLRIGVRRISFSSACLGISLGLHL